MSEISANEKISALRAALKARQQQTTATHLPQFARTTPHIIMSDNQQRIWLHEQQHTESLYALPFAIEVLGHVDSEILQLALQRIVNKHESLRTVFLMEDGKYFQHILPGMNINLTTLDYTNKTDKDIDRKLVEFVKQSFDLEIGPLLRTIVIKTAADRQLLLISMHHIISDGWSLGIMINELFLYYHKILNNQIHDDEALSRQYADFTLWQQQLHHSVEYQGQIDYWQEQLRKLPVLQLPTDMRRVHKRTYYGKRASITISNALWQSIEALAKRENVTVFVYLFTVYGILLNYYSQQADFAIGIATANRPFPELEKLIGFFANTLPCRMQIESGMSFRELLALTKQSILNLFAHQDVSFETLIEKCDCPRIPGYSPLVQTLFVMRDFVSRSLHTGDFQIHHYDIYNDIALFDILMTIMQIDDNHSISIDYNADLLSINTAKKLLSTYEQLLVSTLQHPHKAINMLLADFPITKLSIQIFANTQYRYLEQYLEQLLNQFDITPTITLHQIDKEVSTTFKTLETNSFSHIIILPDNISTTAIAGIAKPSSHHKIITINFPGKIDIEIDTEIRFSKFLAKNILGIEDNTPSSNYKPIHDYLRAKQCNYTNDEIIDIIDSYKQPTGYDKSERFSYNHKNSATFINIESIQDQLLQLWKLTLKTDAISVTDNFLQLGGHSTLAAQLSNNINQIFNIHLPIIKLFECTSIIELSSAIAERMQQSAAHLEPILPVTDNNVDIPLSYSQERLWLLNRIEPNNIAYNLMVKFYINGNLDLTAFEKAQNDLFARHDVFNMFFKETDGRSRIKLRRPHWQAIDIIDISPMDAIEKNLVISSVAENLQHQNFDLSDESHYYRIRGIKCANDSYIIFFVCHHILVDAWSFSLLMHDLFQLYELHKKGITNSLPPLKVCYRDYAYWQHSAGKALLSTQKSYWLKELQNLSLLQIPTDYPRQALQSSQGSILQYEVHAECRKKVILQATQLNTTPFTLYFSAMILTLAYFTGQHDIVVGVPFANRNYPDLENIVGYFVNIAAVRVKLAKQMTLLAFLDVIKVKLLAAQSHQNVPFEMLLDELSLQRDVSRAPLVQVLFNYIHIPENTINVDDVEFKLEPIRPAASKYDFSISIENSKHQSTLVLEYNTDLFFTETMEFVYKSYLFFLETLTLDNDKTVAEIFQQLNIQSGFLQPRSMDNNQIDHNESLYNILLKRSLQYGNKIAIQTFDKTITYHDLVCQINQLASILKQKLSTENEKIGILMGDGIQIITAIFAALAIGKTYVMLATDYPQARLADIITDANIRLILVEPQYQQQAYEIAGDAHVINSSDLKNHPNNIPEMLSEDTENKIAYLLYTSGSTGQPKGVIQSQRNVINHIKNYTEKLNIISSDTILQLASFNFDAAIMDMYGALLNGCTLAIADVKTLGIQATLKFMAEHKVTIYHSTPSLFRSIFKHPTRGINLSAIRAVVFGGEELFTSDIHLAKQHFHEDCVFINGYGPSESTITLQYPITKSTTLARQTVPIGFPMADTNIHLLDESFEVSGLIGQMAIESSSIAYGYWNNSEKLTNNVFMPMAAANGNTVYLTGDYARRLPDGSLLFLGRKDSQVKIRGFKVDLSEIEAILRNHHSVHHAVVLSKSLSNDDTRIVAFITVHHQCSIEVLQEYLRERIPHYMCPSQWMILETLPYTPSGKIDRLKLLAMESANEENTGNIKEGSVTPLMHKLAKLWKEQLNLPVIHYHQNFFDMGGNSLLILQFHHKIEKDLQIVIPLIKLFQYTTIIALANYIESHNHQIAIADSISSISSGNRRREAILKMKQRQERAYED